MKRIIGDSARGAPWKFPANLFRPTGVVVHRLKSIIKARMTKRQRMAPAALTIMAMAASSSALAQDYSVGVPQYQQRQAQPGYYPNGSNLPQRGVVQQQSPPAASPRYAPPVNQGMPQQYVPATQPVAGQGYGASANYPVPTQQVPIQQASVQLQNGVPAHGAMAQQGRPELRMLPVPQAYATLIADSLSLRYQQQKEITIASNPRTGELVVLAPPQMQPAIAGEVQQMAANLMGQANGAVNAPVVWRLQNISWQKFEQDLRQLAGQELPMTSRDNGGQVAYQMNVGRMQGSTVNVDRRQNLITVQAPRTASGGWRQLLESLDGQPTRFDDVTMVHRLIKAEMAPVQRTMRLLRGLPGNDARSNPAMTANAAFQNPAAQPPVQPQGQTQPGANIVAADSEPSSPLGDVQIEYSPDLNTIIVKGNKRDVARVMELIREIENKAELTQPLSEVVQLKFADANAVSALLTQLYEDVLSARQGDVSITSLDAPNALLLIGREEAIVALKELIAKIDVDIDGDSRLRVFRMQNASAQDAQQTILDHFTNRPTVDQEYRDGLGPRVRISADIRTNSLIVSAAPRDMVEVTRLIDELDVEKTDASSEIRVFTLANAVADDLAVTLQEAFSGDSLGASDDTTVPSTSLKIVALDNASKRVVESGILAGATISSDPNGNAIVVKAPSASMPLIAELIAQLDRAPGVESMVKVFTIEYGDAQALLTSLETLFGSSAGTDGTAIGAGNLPGGTAAEESSLVPLRFSSDIRTNSIVASGSLADLEVVESILLRLDGEGFSERITEVIWLRNNQASLVADAITAYVNSRQSSQFVQQISQNGIAPYDFEDRDIIAVAEPNFNTILLSVSPRLYEEVRMLIDRLDRPRPMVMINVMIAEVFLNDVFEIGTELGLQDSLSFDRGKAVSDVPGTVGAGTPGFNFNDANVSNVNNLAQSTVAAAGVSTFGVGTSNSNLGYGGFVLNAASDSFSLLFRTLQDAQRAQILSRPQLMTADGAEAFLNVGRQIARFGGSDVTNVGASQNIDDVDVGINLRLFPRVGRDGTIIMEVDVRKSDRDTSSGTTVTDGTGGTVFIDDIIETLVQATLSVKSGQTVIIGGLIQKDRVNRSRRFPLLANVPIVGNLFKYDFEEEGRRETLIVLTPILVSSEQDTEYINQVESSRMSWCLADVIEAHGDVGLSGGYGLWGPAIGPTIYPDLQPTVMDGGVEIQPPAEMLPQSEGVREGDLPGQAIPPQAVPQSVIPPAQSGTQNIPNLQPELNLGSQVPNGTPVARQFNPSTRNVKQPSSGFAVPDAGFAQPASFRR